MRQSDPPIPSDDGAASHPTPPRAVAPLRIGAVLVDPPVLQAPMAGFTNYAYREIVRHYGGVGLLATEMVSARGFLHNEAQEKDLPDRLWGVRDEPRPLAVQIWDNDPENLAAVGSRLAHEFGVSVVDVNFGCPVRRVSQHARSGSYLLRHPERIGAIVARVVQACAPTPVTAKIRLGHTLDTVTVFEVARAVEEAGGAALTVHGRTAQQMYRGQSDWEAIAAVKAHLRTIPLIGNGDLRSAEAAADAFARYGVDGVMIGRAALHRPWIFRQVRAALCGEPIPPDPSPAEQRDLLLRHFHLVVERFGPQRGTILMRRYACCYATGRPGARKFRSRMSMVATVAEFGQTVSDHFASEEPSGLPVDFDAP